MQEHHQNNDPPGPAGHGIQCHAAGQGKKSHVSSWYWAKVRRDTRMSKKKYRLPALSSFRLRTQVSAMEAFSDRRLMRQV